MLYRSDNFKLVCQACLSRDVEIKAELASLEGADIKIIIACTACSNEETIKS